MTFSLSAVFTSNAVYVNDVVLVGVHLLIAQVSRRPSVHLRNSEVRNLIELILSWTLR